MSNTTTMPSKSQTGRRSSAIRIADEHYAMIAQIAEKGRRTKQSVVSDALDVGLGLVLLHVHNRHAALQIMNDLQAAVIAEMAALPSQS